MYFGGGLCSEVLPHFARPLEELERLFQLKNAANDDQSGGNHKRRPGVSKLF